MEWISVKDRLPEKDRLYIVAHKLRRGRKMVLIRRFSNEYPSTFPMSGEVTHWMPLPEPPKEE